MTTEYCVPANPLLQFRRQMGRLFSEITNASGMNPFQSLTEMLPVSHISENNQAYFIDIAAPGISADEVDLSILGRDLSVTINRDSNESECKGKCEGKYIRQERLCETSTFGVTLPEGVDENDISADIQNGILRIRIPKTEDSQVKKIPVTTK